jgi:hypothetical protein
MMDISIRIYTPNWYKEWFLKKFNRLNNNLVYGFNIPFTKADMYIAFNWLHLFGLQINRYEFCISLFTLSLVIVKDYEMTVL